MEVGFCTAIMRESSIEETVEWASHVGFESLEISTSPESKHMNLEMPPTLYHTKRKRMSMG